MNFDINLVIVPITLAFLLIWLVDKLVLKQHFAIKHHAKEVKSAETQLSMHKQKLELALANYGMRNDAQSYTPDAHAPSDLHRAYQDYQASRAKLATLVGNPPNDTAVVRWAYEFLPVLLAIVIVRAFVIEPFNIPSSSMVPTYTQAILLLSIKRLMGFVCQLHILRFWIRAALNEAMLPFFVIL